MPSWEEVEEALDYLILPVSKKPNDPSWADARRAADIIIAALREERERVETYAQLIKKLTRACELAPHRLCAGCYFEAPECRDITDGQGCEAVQELHAALVDVAEHKDAIRAALAEGEGKA